jgi:hypothetical protein
MQPLKPLVTFSKLPLLHQPSFLFWAQNFSKQRSTKNHQKTFYFQKQHQDKHGKQVSIKKVWLGQPWQDTETP